MRLTILDFCAGEVYSYILTEQQLEIDQEDLLDELGHRSNDCQWMYH
jgi:hypothetical protein